MRGCVVNVVGLNIVKLKRKGSNVKGETEEARFWEKVSIDYYAPSDVDPCWFWTANKVQGGYGRFWAKSKHVLAHRWAYEYFREPIPIGLTIDHLCKVTSCVNPNHLEVVSMEENIHRGESPSAINRRKTHCNNGHKYTTETVCLEASPKGFVRRCIICRNEGARRRWGEFSKTKEEKEA